MSAELCAIRFALDALINYSILEETILCLFDSKSTILLLKKIHGIANDKDLFNIRRQLLNLQAKGNQIYFQHVPSHKGIKYNDTADLLAAKASLLNPSPLSDLNSRDIIRQRSNVNHSKLTLSPFHTR